MYMKDFGSILYLYNILSHKYHHLIMAIFELLERFQMFIIEIVRQKKMK